MIGRRALLGGALAAAGTAVLGCGRAGPADRTHVSLWFTYGGRNRKVLERLVGRFNRSQTDVWVDAIYQGDYYEGLAKLRTAIAARAAPTLSHVIGEVVPYLAEAGVLEPLDDYPGAKQLDIIRALGQSGSWVGGAARPLVALPFNRSTPIAYLNEPVFRTAGFGPPSTWTELRDTARALTRRAGGRTVRHGFGCPISWWFWVALVGQAGQSVVEADGRVTLGGEAGIEALRFWQTLAREDRSMKPPPGRDYNAWEQINQDFLSGRVAMIWTSTAFLHYLEENAPFKVLAAPLPRARRYAVPTGGTHWVMLREASVQNKLAAWAFLRFMHQSEQVIQWSTGTGYLPTTHRAVTELGRSGFFTEHPNYRIALDQLDVSLPWPWSTELFRVEREIVEPRLEEAVLADADARQVLAEARSLAQGRGP
ncbi:MAG: ABC transporter substrate-binding protein [Polyangiaceae bacterium]|nr:ABC transporter substrate-binding protein [Polyangiaceae bacterium]